MVISEVRRSLLQSLSTGKKRKISRAWAMPVENFWNHAFSIYRKHLFDIERVLQIRYFHSFAEKARDPDPQYPLVAHLITIYM